MLKRNPTHAGAIHLYIHAVEASTTPERALPHAERLAALMPGAGHIVHMPAHIYYRVGQYRRSLDPNKRAVAVDEQYFQGSPSDPIYKSAYYPHNIHFVMVSAQMGGDGATAIDAAKKLDAAVSGRAGEAVPDHGAGEGGAVHHPAHVRRSRRGAGAARARRAAGARAGDVPLRAGHRAAPARRTLAAARAEIGRDRRARAKGDFKPYEPWGVPAKAIVQTARLVATGRIADAAGDLDGAAKAYEEAIAIEDTLSYTEPPYWYYPVRQSLGGVRLRQGRLDEAERAFRDSLARRAQQRLGARRPGRGLQAQGRPQRRDGGAARLAREAWFGPAGGPDLARL